MLASQEDFDVVGYAAEFADVQFSVFAFTLDDGGAAEGPVADVKVFVFGLFVGDSQVWSVLLVQFL